MTRIRTVSLGRSARKSRQAMRTSPNIMFWNAAPWWIANDPLVIRHRTSRNRMPLCNCRAIVVFWHSVHGPPNRAPESCVPGIVSRRSSMESGRPPIQSWVPWTALRVAATAGAAPTIAVAETARAPARNPLRVLKSRVSAEELGEIEDMGAPPGAVGASPRILTRTRQTRKRREPPDSPEGSLNRRSHSAEGPLTQDPSSPRQRPRHRHRPMGRGGGRGHLTPRAGTRSR